MPPTTPIVGLVEPWYGESHRAFLDGLMAHCDICSELLTLPATMWKWRMRTGAWPLADLLSRIEAWPDVFLFSDYVNLPSLMGFVPRLTTTFKIVYFHENQLTYPLRRGTKRDFEFCAINVLTCLAADKCIFCSKQQMEAFLDGIPALLDHEDVIDSIEVVTLIEDKSEVIPVGVEMARFDAARQRREDRIGKPLRIVWPHRFEHDKNPEDFFEVLMELADEGLVFEVAAVGKSSNDVPPVMKEARKVLDDRVVQWGFLESDEYADALAASDVVVSTAWQETLGLAVIEAIRSGCDPLLPNRLSYPEVLGEELSKTHLYQNKSELRNRLRRMMRCPDEVRTMSNHHAKMERFSWEVVGPMFNELFNRTYKFYGTYY